VAGKQPSLRQFSRFDARRDVKSLYLKHFSEERQERKLLSTLGFFTTFALVRAITHSIRAGRGPFKNITPGGRHIHHMTFGIVGLLVIGYLWMLEFGTQRGQRIASRATSTCYGAGAALTLDEFALWLNLQDVYWAKQGRESIDAVVLFGSLLALTYLGKDPLREIRDTVNATPRQRAVKRAQRFALYHPDGALNFLARRR
jgi:hypothetical protein